MNGSRVHGVTIAVLFSVVGASEAAGSTLYRTTALSQPVSRNDQPGGVINDQGQVAGNFYYARVKDSFDSGTYQASAGFLYNGSDGKVAYLGTTPANAAPGPAGPTTFVRGLNDSGQAVGYNLDESGNVHGYVSSNGQYASVPGQPVAIHNAGQVAGRGYFANGQFTDQPVNNFAIPADRPTHSYIETGGVLKDLGLLPNTDRTAVGAINDHGQAAGTISSGAAPSPNAFEHAFYYDGKTIKDIGTLGDDRPGSTTIAGINNSGDVIGNSNTSRTEWISHAFVSHRGGPLIDLGTLPGATDVYASGVNDKGQIVGTTGYLPGYTSTYGYAPFLYQKGVMTDLNTLIDPAMGVTLMAALQINNAGQILADGYDNDQPGLMRLFVVNPEDQPSPIAPVPLLEPVPEPSTLAMYAVVLAGVGLSCRRRSAARAIAPGSGSGVVRGSPESLEIDTLGKTESS